MIRNKPYIGSNDMLDELNQQADEAERAAHEAGECWRDCRHCEHECQRLIDEMNQWLRGERPLFPTVKKGS